MALQGAGYRPRDAEHTVLHAVNVMPTDLDVIRLRDWLEAISTGEL
jgi:predicted DNA-binding protein (UPF0251 family)